MTLDLSKVEAPFVNVKLRMFKKNDWWKNGWYFEGIVLEPIVDE